MIGEHRPRGRRPHVTTVLVTQNTVLMNVTADHCHHRVGLHEIREPLPGRIRHEPVWGCRAEFAHPGGHRFVHDDHDRPGRKRVVESVAQPGPLSGLRGETGPEHLGVDADEQPPAEVKGPAVFTDLTSPSSQTPLIYGALAAAPGTGESPMSWLPGTTTQGASSRSRSRRARANSPGWFAPSRVRSPTWITNRGRCRADVAGHGLPVGPRLRSPIGQVRVRDHEQPNGAGPPPADASTARARTPTSLALWTRLPPGWRGWNILLSQRDRCCGVPGGAPTEQVGARVRPVAPQGAGERKGPPPTARGQRTYRWDRVHDEIRHALQQRGPFGARELYAVAVDMCAWGEGRGAIRGGDLAAPRRARRVPAVSAPDGGCDREQDDDPADFGCRVCSSACTSP